MRACVRCSRMSRMRRSLTCALLSALAVLCCAQRTVTVFAAASLKESFTQIGVAFERKHGVKVRFSFAGSQQLAAQIEAGAPADVFASADRLNLAKVRTVNGTVMSFAVNRLAVVVRKGGPVVKDVRGLAGVRRLVLASPKVPVGAYTRTMLERAGRHYGDSWKGAVLGRVVSEEQDVRAVLAKVVLGEADAGIVYATDAVAAGSKVRTLLIPPALDVRADYVVGVPIRAKEAGLAKEFIAFLGTGEAQRCLLSKGFTLPPKRKST